MIMILLLFILIINIVSIVLIYNCLEKLTKKEKFIFIAVGIAIMYIVTSIVYWISTWKIEMNEIAETGKNLITFLFVPINAFIVLPLFAKNYVKFKIGSLDRRIFLNRGIVLTVLILIVLSIECVYFKNIQQQVVNMLQQKENTIIQNILDNEIVDEINNNIITNEVNSLVNTLEE